MRVAMHLGQYWWKRLGEKKIGDFTVSESATQGISLLAVVIIEYFGLLLVGSLGFINVEYYRSLTDNIKFLYQIIAAFVTVLGLLFFIFSVIHLGGSGVVLVRSLIATLRFRTIFCFSPPATHEGQKTIQLAVDRILAFRAIALEEEYAREEKIIEAIRKNKTFVSGLISNKEDYIRDVARSVVSLENELGKLEKQKKKAKRNFYQACDVASNKFLPIPFQIRSGCFKNYLPKKVA